MALSKRDIDRRKGIVHFKHIHDWEPILTPLIEKDLAVQGRIPA